MKTPVKIALAIFAAGFLAVAAIVACGLLYHFTSKSLPLSQQDRRVTVTATDLIPSYDDYSPDASFETYDKVRSTDQSVTVTYEYDSPHEDEPYILVQAIHDVNRRDSNTTFLLEWSSYGLALKMEDSNLSVQEVSSFSTAGDRSRFANIIYHNEMIGHFFVAQKGNSVYTFVLSGFRMDDPTIWQELFDHRIAELNPREVVGHEISPPP